MLGAVLVLIFAVLCVCVFFFFFLRVSHLGGGVCLPFLRRFLDGFNPSLLLVFPIEGASVAEIIESYLLIDRNRCFFSN